MDVSGELLLADQPAHPRRPERPARAVDAAFGLQLRQSSYRLRQILPPPHSCTSCLPMRSRLPLMRSPRAVLGGHRSQCCAGRARSSSLNACIAGWRALQGKLRSLILGGTCSRPLGLGLERAGWTASLQRCFRNGKVRTLYPHRSRQPLAHSLKNEVRQRLPTSETSSVHPWHEFPYRPHVAGSSTAKGKSWRSTVPCRGRGLHESWSLPGGAENARA